MTAALSDMTVLVGLVLALWRLASTPLPLWAGRYWRRLRYKISGANLA